MTKKTSLTFQSDGAPYCERFDDIYFDSNSGYNQSQNIFIEGSKLKEKLKHAKNTVTIIETGFGTGLNLLLTLKAFAECHDVSNKSRINSSLHFISTEKYPLTLQQLTDSISILPELKEYAELLIEQYNIIDTSDCLPQHVFHFFDQKIKVTLLIGDASEQLSTIACNKQGVADIWYLDGFSPRKNPDMWSDTLFTQIARLSKEQATLATFTTSGKVKRLLVKSGFSVEKQSCTGQKGEYTTAIFQQLYGRGKGYQLRPQITKPQHVAMIGGGVAAACAAYALTKQGVKVTLYCKDGRVSQGASSNAIGALFPLVHQQKDDISEFYFHAFWHAKSFYQSLIDIGFDFDHQWCGLLDVAYKPALQKRQTLFEQISAWPKNYIHGVDQQQASKLANVGLKYGGLFMPNAGWVSPQSVVKQLFAAAKATNRLRIEHHVEIKKLVQQSDSSWLLETATTSFKEKIVVVCAGADTLNISPLSELPLTPVRGQITSMNTNDKLKPLSTVICHKGYLTPQHKNIHCIGATFQKNSTDLTATKTDDEYNLNMLEKCLPNLSTWQMADINSAKARLRCMTPDHLPMVGAMPNEQAHISEYSHLRKDKNWRFNQAAPVIDNLYVMTGLGARGLCSAPILADILVGDICGTPYPLNSALRFNVSPNRFIIRDLIKRKI